MALLFGIALLFFLAFFPKKFTIKGYSIESLLHKINEIPSPFIEKYSSFCIRYLLFTTIFFFFFGFDVDLYTLMTAITSIYIVAPPYLHFSFLDFAIKGVAIYFLVFWASTNGLSFYFDLNVVS
jgi:hypothetical protein